MIALGIGYHMVHQRWPAPEHHITALRSNLLHSWRSDCCVAVLRSKWRALAATRLGIVEASEEGGTKSETDIIVRYTIYRFH